MQRTIWFIFVVTIFLTPLIILPFTIDYYHPPKELFSALAIFFCLMLWLIKGIREAKFQVARAKIYLGLVLFCIIAGLSLIWARSRYLGLRDYAQILVYAGAFFICINIIDRQRKAVVIAKAAFIAGLISAAYAIFEYFGFDFIWRFKLYSTFGNPDFLANYLILVFPLGVVFYIWAEEFVKKVLLLLALAVIYGALLVTFSIGALAGLSCGALFIIFLLFAGKVRLRRLMCQERAVPYAGASVVGLIVALGLVSALFTPPVLKQAKASSAWRHGLDNRLISYRAAYGMIRDNPVFGVGIGNFKLRFPEYRGRWIAAQQKYFDSLTLDKQRDRHAHNDLLQVWVETGVFGFIIFALILLAIFKNGIFLYYDLLDHRKRLFVLGLLWSVSSYLFHSLFSFPMHIAPCGLLFWTFAGLLFAYIARRDAAPIKLNISTMEKKLLEAGVIISTCILCIWLGSLYLSDVFLKRMAAADKRGMFEEAFVEAKTSLFFNPHSNAVIYAGNYASVNGDHEAASRYFARALSHNDEINFHTALAESYYKQGLPRAAVNEYEKALLLNPSSWSTRIRLAELYAENKMYGEAHLECQFILMNNAGDEKVKKRIKGILNKIFDERILSDDYGRVQVNK